MHVLYIVDIARILGILAILYKILYIKILMLLSSNTYRFREVIGHIGFVKIGMYFGIKCF